MFVFFHQRAPWICLRLLRSLMAVALLAGCAVASNTNRPVALVIGNGAYRGQIPALSNPQTDAEAVAGRMRNNGFTTVLLVDATQEEMVRTLQAFGNMAVGAPLAVVYYSGHGLEIGGRNVLLPIDFRIENVSDTNKLEEHGVSLAELGKLVSGRAGGTLIMLDACRTDPTLPATTDGKSRSLPPITGVGVGLGDQTLPAATVVYATEPGKTAMDGRGVFSPFTTSVLRFINRQTAFNAGSLETFAPFLPLLRLSVVSMTRGAQVPTWRGPQFPATKGYNTTPAPQVQEIITKSDPNQISTTSIYGVPSRPVELTPQDVQLCRVEAKAQSGNASAKIITTKNSTLCGDMIVNLPSTFKVSEQPKHGKVVFDDQIIGYIPNSGYTGEDLFVLKVYVARGSDVTMPVHVSILPRTTMRNR